MKKNSFALFKSAFSSLLLLFLIACGGSSAPVIVNFRVSQSTVAPGSEVTLTWEVTQADRVTLTSNVSNKTEDIRASGSRREVIIRTTTFTLTAYNGRRSATGTITVTVSDVGQAPIISSFTASRSSVSFREPVTLSWSTSNATSVTITPSPGGTLATNGTLTVNPTARTTYRLVATNSFTSVERELTVDVWLTFMIAGQSNAVGWQPINAAGVTVEQNTSDTMMFANDDSWKPASEPVDSNLGQNSAHGGYDNFPAVTGISGQDAPGHSFGVALGNRLQSGTQAGRFRVALLPTAKGGSNVFASSSSGWRPSATEVRNRTTVFGDALVRAELLEADQNLRLTAILWYQGEADSAGNCGNCNGYIANTKRVFNRMSEELNFSDTIPVFYVQLSHFGDDLSNSETVNNQRHKGWQDIREKQRLMEAGAYNPISGTTSLCAESYMHMVVAHDLAMFDRSHLTAESQKILGDRINRAIREHLLGENIDGTGPRLASISKSGNVIRIATTRTINDSSTYGNYFTVFDGAGNEVPITSMGRDNSRRTDVLLTLASDPGEGYTVRYMPPRDPTGGVPVNNLTDVIRDPSTGLPLPAFGRMVEFASTLDPNFPNSELAGQCTTYDTLSATTRRSSLDNR